MRNHIFIQCICVHVQSLAADDDDDNVKMPRTRDRQVWCLTDAVVPHVEKALKVKRRPRSRKEDGTLAKMRTTVTARARAMQSRALLLPNPGRRMG